MKNIRKGYYLRYDGLLVCVVDTIEEIDTGARLVVCRYNAQKTQRYYEIAKDSLAGTAEAAGKTVPKYRRVSPARALSEAEAERVYQCSGEYPSAQSVRRKKPPRRVPCDPCLSCAKDLCASYLHDVRLSREGAAGSSAEELARAQQNVRLLEELLGGELRGYAEYFRERFAEGKSIRKYAAEHGINRGSAEHLQKKLYAALAECLRRRNVGLAAD